MSPPPLQRVEPTCLWGLERGVSSLLMHKKSSSVARSSVESGGEMHRFCKKAGCGLLRLSLSLSSRSPVARGTEV